MSIRGFNVYGDVQRYDFNFLDNIPPDIGGVSDWLIAEYGVTSGSEITEALNNGKAVAALVNGNVFTLSKSVSSSGSGTTYYFTRVSGTTSSEISVNGTTWTSAIDTELSFRDAFWAEFGTTTADEIRTKANGAKVVLLKYNGVTYYLSNITSSSGNFVCTFVSSTGQNVYTITVTGGVWGAPVIVNLARIDSPALTGVPTAPTADAGTASNQIATTQFVQRAVTAAGGLPSGGTVGQVLTMAPGFPLGSDPLPMWLDPEKQTVILDFTLDANDQVSSGPIWSDIDAALSGTTAVVAHVTKNDGTELFAPLVFYDDTPGTWTAKFSAANGYDGLTYSIVSDTGVANTWVYNEWDINADLTDLYDSKLDNNLGSSQAGKFLVVGSDGNITTVAVPSASGVSF